MPKELSWLPQAALDRMHSDLQAYGEITRAALAERVIEEAAPLAAYTVVELATSCEDETVRLRAAQYLLDRASGKPKVQMQVNVTESNPVLKILDGVVVDRPEEDPDTGTPGSTVLDQ